MCVACREERRDYDRRRDDDRDRSGGSAWRPQVKEGGWRERTRLREESWKRPEPRLVSVIGSADRMHPKLTRRTLSPLYRPKPPSAAPPLTARYRPSYRSKPPAWPAAKTMCLDKSIRCAHKAMTLHTQTLSTTFTNNFCACQQRCQLLRFYRKFSDFCIPLPILR